MTSYVDYNDRTVSLKDLIVYIIKRWKLLLAVVLGICILFTGWKSVKTVNNNKKLEEATQQAETVDQDTNDTNNIVENMDNLISGMEEYLNKSEKMKINPYSVNKGILLYNVENGYFESSTITQNPDNISVILSAYKIWTENGPMFDYIKGNTEYTFTTEELSELVKFAYLDTTNIARGFQITVISNEETVCAGLLTAINNGIKDYSRQLSEKIGEHTLTNVLITQSTVVDNDLKTEQLDSVNGLKNAQSTGALIGATAYVNENSNKIVTVSARFIIKQAVIGAALGVIIALALLVIMYLLTKKFLNEQALKERYKATFLGTAKSKEKLRGLEKLAYRVEDKKLVKTGRTTQYELLAANAKILFENNHCSKIMVFGSLEKTKDKKSVNEFVEVLRASGIEATDYRNILTSSRDLAGIKDYDGFILVEKQDTSLWYNVITQAEKINELSDKPLAFVKLV